MFDFDICQWLASAAAGPSAADVLKSLQEATVCTGTQCFESTDDVTGVLVTPPSQANVIAYVGLAMMLVWLAAATRPATSQGAKPPRMAWHRDAA